MEERIYVLKLVNYKWYIGKSKVILSRVISHVNGNGAAWTSKHKPIDIEEIRLMTSPFDEDNVTKEYMIKYGIDNVRGGSYVKIDLTPEEKGLIQSELWAIQNLCRSCGQSGHFIERCPTPKKQISIIPTSYMDSMATTMPSNPMGPMVPMGSTMPSNPMASMGSMGSTMSSHPMSSLGHIDSGPVFRCDKCSKEYKTQFGYNKHIAKCGTKPKKDKSRFMCKKCGNPGHKAAGCVMGTDKEKEVTCYKCKEVGHYANACTKEIK